VRDTGGPAFDPAPNTMIVSVAAVNDAPAGTDATVTTNEDTAYAFTVANLGFGDLDTGDTLSAVRIDTLTLPMGATLQLSGINVNANDVILVADIIAGNFVFTPVANATGAGYASFTFSVRDTGGPAFDPAPNTMTVNVTAVNDAPAGTDATVTTNEDTAYAFTVANFGFTDVDGGDILSAVRIDALTIPVGATLQLSGVSVSANDVIVLANIIAGNLVFTPALNQNGAGYASFTFSVRDTGGPAFDPAPNTMTLNVTAVNDPPAGTDTTVTTNEDAAYAFTVANFGFTDVDGGDAISAVRIDSLAIPVGATLQLSGINVNASDVVLVADINAGNLVFTPAANQNGAGYASFTFSVRDTGGPAFDAAPNTMTVNVTAVDDLPLAINDLYLTNEDTPLVVAAAAGLFRNDSGLDDGGIALSVLGLPIGGTVVVNNDGSFTFTPTANFNGPASFSYQIADADGDLANATVAITVNPVNDAPTLGNNAFMITDGGALAIAPLNLSATDVDDAAVDLVFTVGGVTNGRFELVSNRGVPITSFTQGQIQAGLVQFLHDGTGVAPTASITVSDGAIAAGPVALNIAFTADGGPVMTPPINDGSAGSLPPAPPPAPVAQAAQSTTATPSAAATVFQRAPTNPRSEGGGQGAEEVAAPVARLPGGSIPGVQVATPVVQLQQSRAESEQIETKFTSYEIEVAPVRDEMQVLPMRGLGDPAAEDERRQLGVVVSAVRITGLAFSVGAVWWAARAAGLVASVLASSPAWRHVDPLPVLGKDEEEESEWVDEHQDDQERKDEEHRAAWVLEGPR
jgi:hypothetical protein